MNNEHKTSREKYLEEYLRKHIPISNAMGITVPLANPQQVVLNAPFTNNINHKQTVFGGSLHAVATLSCWSLLHLNLKELLQDPIQIVISSSHVEYLAPVSHDFQAECFRPDQQSWEYFLKVLKKKKKARINLKSHISQNNRLCVDYSGEFVAIATQ